ncbi:hypothetical protein [Bosea sp. RAC05]|uniref:hypothetical protein n=1 Tax=Bosea sp. RAC05 TaxID=1842539 RepID=UPI00083E522F|nr:hypothetical protein [Bosea sp. RAC05]AOG02854.1 hypothetical protein BSY19_5129 [Bosea sp. RAC05]
MSDSKSPKADVDLVDLAQRCQDILDWKSTGLLKGRALKAFSQTERFAPFREDERIGQAELATVAQAMQALVRLVLPATPKAAPAEDQPEIELESLSAEQIDFLLFTARLNEAKLGSKGANGEVIEVADSLVALGLSENRMDGRWLTDAGKRLAALAAEPTAPAP